MKNVILFVLLSALFSCKPVQNNESESQNTEVSKTEVKDSTEVLEKQVKQAIVGEKPDCELVEQSFVINGIKREFRISWEKNKIKQIDGSIEGKNPISVVYNYDENGMLFKATTTYRMQETDLNYYYDKNLKLVKISGENVFTRTFEYKGDKIVKEKRMKDDKPILTITYEYDNDLPVRSEEKDAAGNALRSHIFTYDNHPNPLQNMGALLNSLEMIYGYNVANAKQNLAKVETTYHQAVRWENKKSGEKVLKTFDYEYNKNGYPVRLSGREDVSFKYSCN